MNESKSTSAIADFIGKIKLLKANADVLRSTSISVGWADESKEQKRARKKSEALAINEMRAKKKRKGKGEIVSNFDSDFVGPGLQAASLATIAKVLRFGRAGGVNKKTGKPYGAIPARDFVGVLRRKHMKPVELGLKNFVLDPMRKKDTSTPSKTSITKLAVICKGQLQRAMMDSNEYKANAPITVKGGWMTNPKNGKPFKIEPKGSSRPLWDKGTLINSVDFEINK